MRPFLSVFSPLKAAEPASNLERLNALSIDTAIRETGDPLLDGLLADPLSEGGERHRRFPEDYAGSDALLEGDEAVLGARYACADTLLRMARRDGFASASASVASWRTQKLLAALRELEIRFEETDAASMIELYPERVMLASHFGHAPYMRFADLIARVIPGKAPQAWRRALTVLAQFIDDCEGHCDRDTLATQKYIYETLGRDPASSSFLNLAAEAESALDAFRRGVQDGAGPILAPVFDAAWGKPHNDVDKVQLARIDALGGVTPEERGTILTGLARYRQELARFDAQTAPIRNYARSTGATSLGPLGIRLREIEETAEKRKSVLTEGQALYLLEAGATTGLFNVTRWRSIARSLSPAMPKTREAVEKLIASCNHLNHRSAAKAAKYLRDAVAIPEDATASIEPSQAHEEALEALSGALEALEKWEQGNVANDARIVDARTRGYDVRLPYEHPNLIDAARLALLRAARLGPVPAALLSEFRRIVTVLEAFFAKNEEGERRRVEFNGKSLRHQRLIDMIDDGIARARVYSDLPEAQRNAFVAAEVLAMHAPNGGKPSAKWRTTTREALAGYNPADLIAAYKTILPKLDAHAVGTWGISEYKTETQTPIHGLVWIAADFPAKEIAKPLTDFALACFVTVPGVGIKAEKAGNACLWALAELPEGAGARHLARIAARVRYPKVKKKIDAALNAAAMAAGMPRAELDELIVPDHGFESGNQIFETEHGSATLSLTQRAKLDLVWKNAAGKIVKSPPKKMREADDTVKNVKALAKEIEADLSVQLHRIERLPIEDRRLASEEWRVRYVEHPLIGSLCRTLIWDTDAGAGLWRDGQLFDARGEAISIDGEVSLWHPINASRIKFSHGVISSKR